MKARILLCMFTLGLLTAMAQPQMPRVLEDGFRLMPNPHHFTVKPMKAADKAEKGIAAKTTKATKRTKARADEPTYQVNFVLDFGENQKAMEIRLLGKESEVFNWEQDIYQLEQGTTTLAVPADTYDIIVTFQQLDPLMEFEWPIYSMYVIREQVTINQDMTLNFAADEAKNHVHFQTLTIDGEPACPDSYAVDENWNWTLLEEGNVEDVYYQSKLFCADYGSLQTNLGNFGAISEGAFHNVGDGANGDFYVNDVSDRWVFYSFRVAIKGRNIYTSAYEAIGAAGDVTVSNDPSQFQLFEDPFVVTNHPGEDVYQGFSYSARTPVDGGWNTTGVTYTTPLSEGESYKFYLGASVDDSEVGYVPYITPDVEIKTIEVIDFGNGETYEQESWVPVMTSRPLTVANGQAIMANNGSFEVLGNEYTEELDELGRDITAPPFWPTHPVFSCPVEQKKDNLGNNCPLLATLPLQYEVTYNWEDEEGNPVSETYRQMEFNFNYMGRYGETKDDSGMAQVNIKVDGEEAITADGAFFAQLEELITGVIDATIVKEGVVIDDMEGSNKTQLHYTTGTEDQNPPTVTMLGFRANNGDVTDRFATADEGTLQFSAGDFNFSLTPNNYGAFERFAPESVEVSYSPYGEDNWNELAVEEVPENYWPTMGWFYTGSLAGVTGEALNGWFDLKIRLTDAAGNWQEQVISPAFRIDDQAYSSVVTITPDKVGDNAIYNLAGQRMRGGLESLPHGIYIVGGKKVVK